MAEPSRSALIGRGRRSHRLRFEAVRVVLPAILLVVSGCGRGCSRDLGDRCRVDTECASPARCVHGQCLWLACERRHYDGAPSAATLTRTVTTRFDDRGRRVETKTLRGQVGYVSRCTYDDKAKSAACFNELEGVVHSREEMQFDADGRNIETRLFGRSDGDALRLRSRYVNHWSSDGCPNEPKTVRYLAHDPATAVGRSVPECDAEGRLVVSRMYGTLYGETSDPPVPVSVVVREKRYEYDDAGGYVGASIDLASPLSAGVDGQADELHEMTLDRFGHVLETRERHIRPQPADSHEPAKVRVSRFDYGCWGGDSAPATAPSDEEIAARAAPVIKALAGRWNFAADAGDKLVFMLDEGKLGVVEKGEYSEVAAKVVDATPTTVTVLIAPPPKTHEPPLRMTVRLIDATSIVLSTPDRPEKKGRMYVK